MFQKDSLGISEGSQSERRTKPLGGCCPIQVEKMVRTPSISGSGGRGDNLEAVKKGRIYRAW